MRIGSLAAMVVIGSLAGSIGLAPEAGARPADSASTKWGNEHSQLCLAVEGGSTHDPSRIIQWGCVGSQDQFWYQSSSQTITRYGHLYQRIMNDNGGCLDVSGNALVQGLQLQQFGCVGGPGGNKESEYWTLKRAGSDKQGRPQWEYQNLYSGMCMADEGSSTKWGGAIVQWPCNGHDDQYWYPY